VPGPAKSFIEQDIRIAGKTFCFWCSIPATAGIKICRDLSEILEYDKKLEIIPAISCFVICYVHVLLRKKSPAGDTMFL
jgi:hypothetical protein